MNVLDTLKGWGRKLRNTTEEEASKQLSPRVEVEEKSATKLTGRILMAMYAVSLAVSALSMVGWLTPSQWVYVPLGVALGAYITHPLAELPGLQQVIVIALAILNFVGLLWVFIPVAFNSSLLVAGAMTLVIGVIEVPRRLEIGVFAK